MKKQREKEKEEWQVLTKVLLLLKKNLKQVSHSPYQPTPLSHQKTRTQA